MDRVLLTTRLQKKTLQSFPNYYYTQSMMESFSRLNLTCAGAFMFQYIEEPLTERESHMVLKRKEAVMMLWNITER